MGRFSPEPEHVSRALRTLISVRGLAATGAEDALKRAWVEAVGETVSARTRILRLRNGILEIGVDNSALLGELVSFRRAELIVAMQERIKQPAINDLKFVLKRAA